MMIFRVPLLQAGGRGAVDFTGSKTARALHDFVVENLPTEVVNLRTKQHLDDFKVTISCLRLPSFISVSTGI